MGIRIKIAKYAFIFAGTGLFALSPNISNAQKTSADFSQGVMIVGPDTRDCSLSLEGAIRYNGTSNKIEFCNGSDWTVLGE